MFDVETYAIIKKRIASAIGGSTSGSTINDAEISEDTMLSSQKIVDTVCPPFSVSGSIVQCTPVENYELGVKVDITLIQEGNGDPSPENVRPIVGCDSVNLWHGGKNLIDGSLLEIGGYGGATGTPYQTDTRIRTAVFSIPCNKQFYLSFLDGYIVTNSFLYGKSKSMNKTLGGSRTNNKTFNSSDADFFFAASLQNKAGTALTEYDVTALAQSIQLELGSIQTSYEPYRGETYTIQLGQTIYGGTLNLSTGILTVTHKHFSLPISEMNNSENFPGWTDVEDLEECAIPDFDGPIQNTITNCLNKIWINTKYQGKRIYGTSTAWGMTQSELKAAYPDLVCEIVMPLLTPATFQLTPQQIHALSGVNTLYADAGDVTVTGVSDPGAAIATLQDRLTALENNTLN